jgi:hypothetical protein
MTLKRTMAYICLLKVRESLLSSLDELDGVGEGEVVVDDVSDVAVAEAELKIEEPISEANGDEFA